MIAIVVLAATLVIVVSVFSRLLVSQQRAHARREDLLLNQLMHATGKTWTPPPATARPIVEVGEQHKFTASPEQDTP